MHNDNADTYFSYDAHGRVKRVIQHAVASNKYSTVDYVYSALTSQVQQIIYQQDLPTELFIHRYKYDKDSRLDSVQVSRDGTTWQQAGKYTYYIHGPLKSKVLGDSIQLVGNVPYVTWQS